MGATSKAQLVELDGMRAALEEARAQLGAEERERMRAEHRAHEMEIGRRELESEAAAARAECAQLLASEKENGRRCEVLKQRLRHAEREPLLTY